MTVIFAEGVEKSTWKEIASNGWDVTSVNHTGGILNVLGSTGSHLQGQSSMQ